MGRGDPVVRLGHAADLHFSGDGSVDPETGKDGRRERLRRAWGWVVGDAIRRGVTHFAIAGDVFHSPQPEPEDYVVFFEGVAELLSHGVQVVAITGNHDVELAAGLSHALRAADVVARLPGSWNALRVLDRPAAVDAGGVVFVGFPHPHKRALDIELSSVPIEERVEHVSRRLQAVIEAYAERYAGAIAVAHVTTVGARAGAEKFMALGWDVSVPAESFGPFAYAALGHIHWPQLVAANAAYPGPIERLSFNDADVTPGYVVADVGTPLRVEFVPYPEATRYVTISRGMALEDPARLVGAHVRVVGVRDSWAEAVVEHLRRAQGLRSVADMTKVERSETTTAPEITTAVGPLEALRQYAALRPPADVAVAEARLRELLEAVR